MALAYAAFVGFVLLMVGLDLGVLNRKAHVVKTQEALVWTAVWIGLALVFNVIVFAWLGADQGWDFLAGYLVEKSLSIDNLFVFIVVFGALKTPAEQQHRVLSWGILSALVLRGAMILLGVELIDHVHAIIYVFGGFLIVTGVRLFRARNDEHHESGVLNWVQKLLPATTKPHGKRFLVRDNGKLLATPLLVALVAVELSDIVFALDSIPAVFAITKEPFIVFTSNVFAMLGLRSLYFALAGMLEKFRYLKVGLSVVLVFVGAKMAASDLIHVPSFVSLAVIVGVLVGAVIASVHAERVASKATGGVQTHA